MTKYAKEKIYAAIRNNDFKLETVNEFTTSTKVSNKAFTEIQEQLIRNQVVLSKEDLASFVIPNTISAAKLLAWFENFFRLIGDLIEDEIHLDCCPKQEYYEEFSDNMKLWFGDSKEEILGFSSFLKIWDLCFPHVIVRDGHKIGSHCKTCERLSTLRKRTRHYNVRMRASELHAYHRHMFMSEKKAYHNRIIQAIMNPDLYCSLIGDGMDKEKTKLPRLEQVHL